MPRHNPNTWILISPLLLSLAGCGLVHTRARLVSSTSSLPADGREHQIAVLTGRYGLPLSPEAVQVTGAFASSAQVETLRSGQLGLGVRAPVQPGELRVSFRTGSSRIVLPVTFTPTYSDSFADGTPDWMRLHSEDDRRAFRRWFTELAERAADSPPALLPPEIIDCASLLRYAYREALHIHDDRWYAQYSAEAMPPLASVQQWSYPNTPLGAALFRTRPGPFQPGDQADGAFAQFADAKTLHAENTYLVGRDLRIALPGDLIFYRLLETDSQYHSMIITGKQGEWVVYHTGPSGGHRGEMRRVLLADLLHHPDPRWRPERANPNFLGVFRWNILREH